MARLAIKGGPPITDDLVGQSRLVQRKDLERQYLLDAYDSGVWDDWPGVDSQSSRFVDEFADFAGARYCVLATNGTHTLQLALESLGVGVGDEVIVPGLTWQATASVVCDVNAVPVIVDVDPRTLAIDPAAVEQAVTDRTRAIIPVHLYHRLADLDALRAIADPKGIAIVEDCAHVHGSRWRNHGIGTVGDLGSFSFQRSKLLNSGEGGALLTNDEDLYHRLLSLRSCGRASDGRGIHSGNFRLSAFQAAILRGQLAALKENADIFDETGLALDRAVSAAPGVEPLLRDGRITRQCSYGFVFLYDSDQYEGLPAAKFRKALKAELGMGFGTCYEPLNQSDVYYPHTKKRHNLSDEYLERITPSRWSLPVAEDLWANRIVHTLWTIFGIEPGREQLLTDAITKIYENRNELLGGDE